MSPERIRQRTQVPSERERAAGVAILEIEPVVEGVPIAEEPPAESRRAKIRRVIADLNPQSFAGGRPLLPLIVLASAIFFAALYDNALGLLLPEIRADFAFDIRFLVTLGGLMSAVTLLIGPGIGYLLDRVNRVRMFRAGVVVGGAAAAATGLATGLPLLVAGRVGTGAGNGVAQPAVFPLLADSYPVDSRARIYSLGWLAAVLAQMLGPIVGGVLGVAVGWRITVFILGGATVVVGLVSLVLREPVRGYEDKIAAGASAEVAAEEQPAVSWGESWRAARSITTVRRLWYAAPFMQLAGTTLLPFMIVYYAAEFGLTLQQRAYILVANGAVGVVALLIGGPVADRIMRSRPGRLMVIMGGLMVLQAAVIVGFAVSPSAWFSLAVNLPLAFASNLFTPALLTLLSATMPARMRSLGLQTVAPWLLLGLVFTPVLGTIANHLTLRHALLVLPPLYLIAAVILGTASSGVERDIRAARAADLAEETARKARREGRRTMLVCRDVDVTYDGVQVLFGVDLDVEEGELVALLGTNGAGKSTLLRAIAGVHEASNGAIFMGERDITHVPPHEVAAAGVVLVPGGRAIFPTLTVDDNLRAAAWMQRGDEDAIATRTEQVLAYFPSLRARLGERAGNLSGGEQQMLALGQAFLMEPKLLMIDELSLGLAPAVVEQLLEILRAIHSRGTTIILVEQSINIALTVAQRAVFMEKGEVRFVGATEELLHRGDVMRSVFLGGARTSTGLTRATTRAERKREETEVVLEATGLRVRFGGVDALQDAHLRVSSREIVGIIGPNGAGKTTLFDVLAGIVTPDAGTVAIAGADVTQMSPEARARLGLGRSFQSARLFSTLTARETIEVALDRHLAEENALLASIWAPKVRKAERRAARRAAQLIDLLGLGAYADKFVGELSTATRRIVDIACIMASEPRALLLDEPSSGLAQAETEELGPVLERLVRETGCGLALIEHDIPLVTSLSHRMVAMDLGRVLVEGTPSEVVENPDVIRAYLGTSDDVIARSGRA